VPNLRNDHTRELGISFHRHFGKLSAHTQPALHHFIVPAIAFRLDPFSA
jgi:hypothetical protein